MFRLLKQPCAVCKYRLPVFIILYNITEQHSYSTKGSWPLLMPNCFFIANEVVNAAVVHDLFIRVFTATFKRRLKSYF